MTRSYVLGLVERVSRIIDVPAPKVVFLCQATCPEPKPKLCFSPGCFYMPDGSLRFKSVNPPLRVVIHEFGHYLRYLSSGLPTKQRLTILKLLTEEFLAEKFVEDYKKYESTDSPILFPE